MNDIAKVEESKQVSTSDASGLVSMIERVAANPEVDVDKLSKLLDMQERVLDRNAEMAFNSAMALMQGELPVIRQTGEIVVNGQVRSRYAKFEDINEAVKPIMREYGFAMTFKTNTNDNKVIVVGILTHREGHRESTDIVLPVDTSGSKNPVQAVGSSVAYGKRYVMCALLNITTTGEDDDAAGTVDKLSDEQVANIIALLDETGGDKQKFVRYISGNMCKSLEEVPAKLYDKAVKALEAKRKAVADA